MRKNSILLSMLVLAAMVLAACGGGATSTNVVESPPPVTADVTNTATESPTEDLTGTLGVPVTGDVNPARVSSQLDFTVWNQDGEQIGEVNDMVLDLDNSMVAYVVVGTGGFLDLGEREIVVPWNSLQLQTGTGDTTGGQQNAFILQSDMDTFSNAPDFDLRASLPQMGQPAADWDADIRNFWEGGGATANNTPSADATAVPEMTATGTTDQATAPATEPATEMATEPVTTQGAGQAQALQGVVLASEVLGSTIELGTQGIDEGQATEQPATEPEITGTATTATAAPEATEPATEAATEPATGQDNMTATIEDLITETDTGNILYIVVNTTLEAGERWIPVPLGLFQWNSGSSALVLNADSAMLQNAPFFQDGLFPDTTMEGWNSEFDTFWQSNEAGAGAEATATP